MAFTVSPNQDAIDVVLAAFLAGIVPSSVKVILGQENRVPEPIGDNFVLFWLLRRPRLATNVDTYSDVIFTASIAGSLMTVTAVETGEIRVGAQVFGTGLASGTVVITALGTGSGGTGTYTVSPSGTAVSQSMAAGGATQMQATQVDYQVEAHGPDSADLIQVISTLLRDPYAAERFAELDENVSPLYSEDPMQLPFVNEQQQVENRWAIQAHLQANQTVIGIPQQFADTADIEVINVETL